jgi:2-(1,2-epoxy-1,2-dihydrophenyl)acetyl-CoA isomerase
MTSLQADIRIEQEGSTGLIRLNRPETLNAFDRAMIDRFRAAVRTLGDDPAVRAIIITGTGRAFSAGQDVRELQKEEAQDGPHAVGNQLRNRYNPVLLRLRTIAKPVVAAINGVTTGAGLGIALACDLRIAADDARFGISPVGIGLIPAAGATALLPALIGLSRATELAFLGERISASRALEIGLIHQVVSQEHVLPTAQALAARLAELPTATIGLTKQAFNAAVFGDLNRHLSLEADLQEMAATTEDHRDGLAALLEKRPPRFTGQ